jgi:hypothetical protein
MWPSGFWTDACSSLAGTVIAGRISSFDHWRIR